MTTTSPTVPDFPSLLEQRFGFTHFRPLQEDIVKHVLAGHDCLAVMPTGGGKSLCFQLPALCLEGVTLVISPLIALMKDQVDGLRADGVAAAFLNSTQDPMEQEAVKAAVRAKKIKLLYVAPERLASQGFLSYLSTIMVSLIAIDEAHCISEWGHEFRPEYRSIAKLHEAIPRVPWIALTATATPQVREDIRQQLKLPGARLFLSSFNRTNLTYHVYPKARTFERLLVALKAEGKLPAIVYCFSRKDTEALAADLRREGFSCLPYHAGLEPSVRRATQETFMRDEVDIITATVAFGMGIDKPNVRTVVHMDLPKNIEGYYQETGRAGRDGQPSDCLLFYSYADKMKQDYFIEQMDSPEQREIAKEQLRKVLKYGELATCRRAYLLRHFGEKYDLPSCGACDRCLIRRDTFDASGIAKKILSAVIATGERFGIFHISAVLLGKNLERIRIAGHDELSAYGSVKDYDDQQLREIMQALLEKHLLTKAIGPYPILSVTPVGHDFLRSGASLQLPKPEETVTVAERKKPVADLVFDSPLFEDLRKLRLSIAKEQSMAAFIVFSDRTLKEMAAYVPQSLKTLQHIHGISERKAELYGEKFLGVIRNHAKARSLQEQPVPERASRRRREAAARERENF